MLEKLAHQLLIILIAGLIAGTVFRRLKISVLAGYLSVGILIGSYGLGLVRHDDKSVQHLAEAGVFLLLFSIGLEFSLDELRRMGKSILIGGGTQMVLVAVPLALILAVAGLTWRAAILIGAALSFSSTVLVYKALVARGHIHQDHGRKAVGILLFQDAALIPLLLLVPFMTGEGDAPDWKDYVRLAVVSIVFLVAVVLLREAVSRVVIPRLVRFRNIELMVLLTLVGLGCVTVAADSLGLPPAVGAFSAGLIFGGNRWSSQIESLILPFRESFAAVFFVSLGLLCDPRPLWHEPLTIGITFALLVLIKWAAATVALLLGGIRQRAAAAMGLGLAHVGEFAFLLLSLGLARGVIAPSEYERLILLSVISLIVTPILLDWSLRRAGKEAVPRLAAPVPRTNAETPIAVIFGAGPIGRQVASQLEMRGAQVRIVDLSPVNLHPFSQQGFETIAGDVTDPEVLALAKVAEATLVVIAVPDDDVARLGLQSVRKQNPHCHVMVRCRYRATAPALFRDGANDVVSEEAQASEAIVRLVKELHEPLRGPVPGERPA